MPLDVKTGTNSYPWALGLVRPGADFATASAALTMNIRPVNVDGTPDKQFNSIWIQASLDNSDTIYICSTAAAPDLVLKTNVLGELAPGQWYPRSKEWANNRAINTLFIGAKNAVDHAVVSLDAF